MVQFEAIKEFDTALAEVEILVNSAIEAIKDERRYATYNKAAILLLAGKFENFAEALAEEYIYHINLCKLNSNTIPNMLKLQHSFFVLSQIEALKHKSKANKAIEVFNSLGELWGTSNSFDALKTNCKFAYGKHGEEEFRRLFANIGIENVFDAVVIYRKQSEDDPASLAEIDFKGDFNSVTGMRNNILHQDATPTLTHVAIQNYQAVFRLFAEKLTDYLASHLDTLLTCGTKEILLRAD